MSVCIFVASPPGLLRLYNTKIAVFITQCFIHTDAATCLWRQTRQLGDNPFLTLSFIFLSFFFLFFFLPFFFFFFFLPSLCIDQIKTKPNQFK